MPPENPSRSLLIKPVSGDCNLHCAYCFYHERSTDPYKDERRHRMSPEVLETVIAQGMALDRRQATFGWQGGEPTLAGLDFFRQVVELQKKHGAAGQVVSNGLQTNGLLLDPEWARFLRQYNFLLGVSLDGPALLHDHYRTSANGSPTQRRVLDVLRMLGQYRVEFNILAVVNRLTAERGVEIYDYLVTEGFDYLQFIPCVEVDPHTGELTDFLRNPGAVRRFPVRGVRPLVQRGRSSYLGARFRRHAGCVRGPGGAHVLLPAAVRQLCGGGIQRRRVSLRLLRARGSPPGQCHGDAPGKALCGRGAEALLPGPRPPRGPNARSAPGTRSANRAARALCELRTEVPLPLSRLSALFRTQPGGVYGAARSGAGTEGSPHPGPSPIKTHGRGEEDRDAPMASTAMPGLAAMDGAPKAPVRPVGRNDPCPCGSGRKYKQCCGRKGAGA